MSGWRECWLEDELDSMQTMICSSATEPLAHPRYSTQLIDGDGTFNVVGIENFVKEMELAKCALWYAVVSIIGPQSSGKSTLLNCLFGTDFLEMDALEGRSQTTKGIWIAKCADIEPCTLVLDLEGTDGQERGEDNTTFAKQSALFALVVSDIVLINMWCHDIGREHAANRPLLRTIFQVGMKLFTPRKITLLFVIRDKTRTPLDHLEKALRKDIEKIWENVTKSKSNAQNETPLSEFFNVEVVALSSYEKEEEQFKEEVASLRQKICDSIILGELAGDRCERVHASDFSYSSQQIWEKIKADKDLDLPSHKVMVAMFRCEKIATEKYETFMAKEEWHQLEEDMNCSPTPAFVNKLNSQIDACLSEYDAETTHYDEGARSKYQNQLKEKLLQLFAPAFVSALNHIRSRVLDEFKYSFTKALNGGEGFSAAACNCIVSSMSHFGEACPDVVIEKAKGQKIEVMKKLRHDIDAHVKFVLTSSCQAELEEALSRPVKEALLNGASGDPWQSIRKLLKHETESAVSRFSVVLALIGFDIDEDATKKMILHLKDYARGVVEEKARDEARRALRRMNERFTMSFGRVRTGKHDIPAIAKIARSASLKLLSVLAAIRLDDDDVDDIEKTLEAKLLDSSSSAIKDWLSKKFDPLLLASDSWEQVPSCRVLIGPRSCKKLWRQFLHEMEPIISKEAKQQEVIDSEHTWSSTFGKVASILLLSIAGGAAINTSFAREWIMSLLAIAVKPFAHRKSPPLAREGIMSVLAIAIIELFARRKSPPL